MNETVEVEEFDVNDLLKFLGYGVQDSVFLIYVYDGYYPDGNDCIAVCKDVDSVSKWMNDNATYEKYIRKSIMKEAKDVARYRWRIGVPHRHQCGKAGTCYQYLDIVEMEVHSNEE